MEILEMCPKKPMALCRCRNDYGCDFEYIAKEFGIDYARKRCPAFIIKNYPELKHKYNEAVFLERKYHDVEEKAAEIKGKDEMAAVYLEEYARKICGEYMDASAEFYEGAEYHMANIITREKMRHHKVESLLEWLRSKAKKSAVYIGKEELENELCELVIERENAHLRLKMFFENRPEKHGLSTEE